LGGQVCVNARAFKTNINTKTTTNTTQKSLPGNNQIQELDLIPTNKEYAFQDAAQIHQGLGNDQFYTR
jgi:hypothetical protein